MMLEIRKDEVLLMLERGGTTSAGLSPTENNTKGEGEVKKKRKFSFERLRKGKGSSKGTPPPRSPV
jgi:hypothetical protein